MTEIEIMHKVQLVKGEFTAMEASDIVEALISQKINFHKIQRLQNWEREHGCNQEPLEGRIKELVRDKKAAKEFLQQAEKEGFMVKINGKLEITLLRSIDPIDSQESSDN